MRSLWCEVFEIGGVVIESEEIDVFDCDWRHQLWKGVPLLVELITSLSVLSVRSMRYFFCERGRV